MSKGFGYDIGYGKARIPIYRAYARPLRVAPIPESAFTGRGNELFALEVDVEVGGDNFLPAYTQGDNSSVVATDSMKNFVLRRALDYDGATLEGFLDLLGRSFLETYSQMQSLRLTAREQPFISARVPAPDGGFRDSALVFARSGGDYSWATLDVARDGNRIVLAGHQCGRAGMALLKVTGSAFTRFVRDAHTTLPERTDRPLFIPLDVSWTYRDPAVLLAPDYARYVAGEQVRDLVCAVFDGFVSESIQHLVHEMGIRLLARFPQLQTVSFAGRNRTSDPVASSDADPKVRVYTDPFSAYGLITLTLRRNDAE